MKSCLGNALVHLHSIIVFVTIPSITFHHIYSLSIVLCRAARADSETKRAANCNLPILPLTLLFSFSPTCNLRIDSLHQLLNCQIRFFDSPRVLCEFIRHRSQFQLQSLAFLLFFSSFLRQKPELQPLPRNRLEFRLFRADSIAQRAFNRVIIQRQIGFDGLQIDELRNEALTQLNVALDGGKKVRHVGKQRSNSVLNALNVLIDRFELLQRGGRLVLLLFEKGKSQCLQRRLVYLDFRESTRFLPSTTRSVFGKTQRLRSLFADTPTPSSSSAPKSSCCRRVECSLRIGAATRW